MGSRQKWLNEFTSKTIVLIDSVLGLNLEIGSGRSEFVLEELLRRVARSGNLTAVPLPESSAKRLRPCVYLISLQGWLVSARSIISTSGSGYGAKPEGWSSRLHVV